MKTNETNLILSYKIRKSIMKLKLYFNWHVRRHGGLFIGIRFTFPIAILEDPVPYTKELEDEFLEKYPTRALLVDQEDQLAYTHEYRMTVGITIFLLVCSVTLNIGGPKHI